MGVSRGTKMATLGPGSRKMGGAGVKPSAAPSTMGAGVQPTGAGNSGPGAGNGDVQQAFKRGGAVKARKKGKKK